MAFVQKFAEREEGGWTVFNLTLAHPDGTPATESEVFEAWEALDEGAIGLPAYHTEQILDMLEEVEFARH